MIKGWRNNPQWVAYYEKKQQDKFQRRLERMRLNSEVDRALDRALSEAEQSRSFWRVRCVK